MDEGRADERGLLALDARVTSAGVSGGSVTLKRTSDTVDAGVHPARATSPSINKREILGREERVMGMEGVRRDKGLEEIAQRVPQDIDDDVEADFEQIPSPAPVRP